MENIEKNKNSKNKVIIGVILLLIAGGVAGMYYNGWFSSDLDNEKDLTKEENNIVCFMEKNPQDAEEDETKDGPMIDYEVVEIEFINDTNKVQGIYNIVPFDNSAQRGKFTGVLENDIFKTDYAYSLEEKEERINQEFKLGNGGLLVGEEAEEEKVFQKFLPKVDCTDTEFRQNIKIYEN